MAAETVEALKKRLISELIVREGPYVNHPSDRGGKTTWGLTEAVARYYGWSRPMEELTQAFAAAVYDKRYFTGPGLEAIVPLSPRIAEELFDTGVNMGTVRASRFLQRALNLLNRRGKDYPDIAVDGWAGQETAGALQAYLRRNPSYGELVLMRALEGQQIAHYMFLAEKQQTQEDFLNGWLLNRVTLEMPRD